MKSFASGGRLRCYVDESIHAGFGFVATAFVFSSASMERAVARELRQVGLRPQVDEFKSSSRMDSNPKMRRLRESLLGLAAVDTSLAVFLGPFDRSTVGKHSLQALQSTLLRNGIRPSRVSAYFDEGIFSSAKDARRLHRLFHFLRACRLYPEEDSRLRLGLQVADVVAHSFGQVLKERLSKKPKMVDIGGRGTGYSKGTKASLGWSLRMRLRYALMTRPMVYDEKPYLAGPDPVVLDPVNDDPVAYGEHPILIGWGVQVAPDADEYLRRAVEEELGRIWLGCIH